MIALFVAGTRTVTLPKRMWDGIRYEIDPTVSAVSTLIVLFTSILVVLAFRFSPRRTGHARRREELRNGG